MKLLINKIYGQAYLLPYLAITHNKNLNGNYEVFIGWLKWELVLAF